MEIAMKALFSALVGLGLSALAVPSFAADEAACKTTWETVDANKDGSVDATEGQGYLTAIAATPDTQKFDTDTDGKLTTAEFTEACKADAFKDVK